MNPVLRTSLLTAIALTSIDTQARPLERCILSLEASPANVQTSGDPMRVDPYSRPCPFAVTYPGRTASRNDARTLRFRSPALSEDEARLDHPVDVVPESVATPRPTLHV